VACASVADSNRRRFGRDILVSTSVLGPCLMDAEVARFQGFIVQVSLVYRPRFSHGTDRTMREISRAEGGGTSSPGK